VARIHLVRDESLQVREKARKVSRQDEQLSVSQRGIRSKRLFTYNIPHFSYLHLIDHQRHQLQPFDLSYLQRKLIYFIYPSLGWPAFRWPLCLSRSSVRGSQGIFIPVAFSMFFSVTKVIFCSDISINFVIY